MNEKKQPTANDCGCEHHREVEGPTHHVDGQCPTDLWVEKMIENVKEELESEESLE